VVLRGKTKPVSVYRVDTCAAVDIEAGLASEVTV